MSQARSERPDPPIPRRISYRELKIHSDYSDAWLSINGSVFDITHFIARHPAGDTFRGNLGTECGALFSSAHMNTAVEELLGNEKFLRRNGILYLGQLDMSEGELKKTNDNPFLDRIMYEDTRTDDFWQDLKTEVKTYIRTTGETTTYTTAEGIAYVAYYLMIYAVLSYLTWGLGSWLASGLLGFHMLCAVANVSHMVTHDGFTRNRMLNFFAAHIFDIGGMSWLEWQISHQTHHDHPHSSIDYQTNKYGDNLRVRIHTYVKLRVYHRFQHVYFWIVVSPYLLFRIFLTSFWVFKNRKFTRHGYEDAAHAIARCILVAPVVYCGATRGWGDAFILFMIYTISYSYSAFVLLYNDHRDVHDVLGSCEDPGRYHGRLSWAKIQVLTSNDWYPTNAVLAFIEFHYGYFNYHIEHHLFPTFKPRLLKKISPIVRSVCARHGVPYIRTTFWEVQRSLQRHLFDMGRVAREDRREKTCPGRPTHYVDVRR